jgi:hypothetical protein
MVMKNMKEKTAHSKKVKIPPKNWIANNRMANNKKKRKERSRKIQKMSLRSKASNKPINQQWQIFINRKKKI